jgi:PAS domain S-box-containing protein
MMIMNRTKQINQYLLTLRQIHQIIIQVKTDRQRLIDEISKILIQNSDYSKVWIVLLDQDKHVTNVASTVSAEYNEKIKLEFAKQQIPACAAAVIAKGTILVIQTNSAYCRDCLLGPGAATKLAAPLTHAGKLWGIITLEMVTGIHVGEEEIGLFDELANDIAFALHDIETEENRLKAEQALAESEHRYRSLFNGSNDAIYVHLPGVEGRFIDVNEKACQQLGYTRRELLAMSPKDIDNPEFALKAVASAGRLLKEGHGVLEMEHVAKDGHLIPVELSTKSIILDGVPLQMTISRDLTERKKAEAELSNLAKFPQEDPNPVLRISRDGKILYANEAGVPILEYFDAGQGEYLLPKRIVALREFFSKKSPSLVEINYQGTVYQLNITPIEGSEYINIYGRDITEARQNDDLIRQSEEKYRVLFNFGNDGAFIYQPHENFWPGTILDCNRAFMKLLGYSKEELIGKKITDIVKHTGEQDITLSMDILKEQGSSVSERVYFAKDGREIPVEISSSLFTYLEKPTVMTTVRDLTKRKQAEESLKRSEARLASAIEAAGLYLHEEKGDKRVNRKMTYIDDRMRNLLGIPKWQDYRAREYWLEHIHPADYQAIMVPAINRFENEGENIVTAEYRYLHETRGEVWFRHIVNAIQRDEKGEVLHLVGAVIDISGQKHLQEEQA